MKTQIERAEPSRGAPDAADYGNSQDRIAALKAEVEKFMEVANKNAQERNAAVDREVVLLEALNGLIEAISQREDKHGERFAPEILHACAVGEAAIQQAERT